tara:strand:+ start:6404 stop:7615 length:1212 start_codon:yes stop_codon:yes gene_type:complete
MNNLKKNKYKEIAFQFLFITLFVIFLVPYAITSGSRVIVANYSFFLFPIIIVIFKGTLKLPRKNTVMLMVTYFVILIISTLYSNQNINLLDRRLISFLLFMSIFFYLVINIDKNMLKAFKIAIVVISLGFIIYKISRYLSIVIFETSEGGNLKSLIGWGRFGFVYIFGFWITVFYKPTSKLLYMLKHIFIALFIIGIFITYSKSTMLSLLISLVFYYSMNYGLIKKIFYFAIIPVSIFSFYILFQQLCPGAEEAFISDRSFCSMTPKLGDIIDLNSSITDRLSMVNSSEGFRIFMFLEIFKYVLFNPFTGSGFLGCWIIFASGECSAHSQYGDVLFRTGFIGLFIYLFILFQVFKYLKKYHRDLFFGFIGALIFGLFNETFKLSQGAFILTFLIGITLSKKQK